MRYLTFFELLLIFSLPLLLFLLASDFAAFDDSFYKEKFLQYGVRKNVPNADLLHQKVMNFIQSKSGEIPGEFNERENQHLTDVRNLITASRDILYLLLVLFITAFVSASALEIKIKTIGKVLFFGGALTIAAAAILFLLIILDFSPTFESLHRIFFKSGTYSFDPSKEIIVNLYPEELFMDLGMRISAWIVGSSIIITAIGAFLLFKSKKNK